MCSEMSNQNVTIQLAKLVLGDELKKGIRSKMPQNEQVAVKKM